MIPIVRLTVGNNGRYGKNSGGNATAGCANKVENTTATETNLRLEIEILRVVLICDEFSMVCQ
jgi:hypothetical protein